ncbi:MAG: hypothetical protein RL095_89 [Verrucomicrobiota bacterium]|jgi:hypothetical protein
MRLPLLALFISLLGSCQDTGSIGIPEQERETLEAARLEEIVLLDGLEHPVCLLAVGDENLVLLRDGRIVSSARDWPELPGEVLCGQRASDRSGICLSRLADGKLQLLRLEDGKIQHLGFLPGVAPASLARDREKLLAASANGAGGSDIFSLEIGGDSFTAAKRASSQFPVRSLLALPDGQLAWTEAREDRPEAPAGPDAPGQRLMLLRPGAAEASVMMSYNHTPAPAFEGFGLGRAEARIFRPDGIERFHPSLTQLTLLADRPRNWIRAGSFTSSSFEHKVFLPFLKFTRPRDILVDRQGRLLVLEDDSQLGHLGGRLRAWSYQRGNRDPLIQLSLSAESGPAPLMLTADASGSTDKDGDPLAFSWKLNSKALPGDKRLPLLLADKGSHELELKVEDSHGGSAVATRRILVGIDPLSLFLVPDSSLRPEGGEKIQLISRGKSGETAPGQAIAELRFSGLDQTPPRRQVSFEPGRSFETSLNQAEKGRSALIQVRSFEKLKTEKLYCSAFSHPSRLEAEFAGAGDGVKLAEHRGARAVQRATGGSGWILVEGLDLGGITKLKARIATQGAGGSVSLRLGSPAGPGLGSFAVPAGEGEWKEFEIPLHNNPSGRSQLWIFIVPDRNRSSILWLDWIAFLSESKEKDGKDPRHP